MVNKTGLAGWIETNFRIKFHFGFNSALNQNSIYLLKFKFQFQASQPAMQPQLNLTLNLLDWFVAVWFPEFNAPKHSSGKQTKQSSKWRQISLVNFGLISQSCLCYPQVVQLTYCYNIQKTSNQSTETEQINQINSNQLH